MSVHEGAALPTNCIDDRPEGSIKVSEPCVSHHGKTNDEQFTENLDCGRPARYSQMRTFGHKETIFDPSRESTGNCKRYLRVYGSPFDVIFADSALTVLYVTSGLSPIDLEWFFQRSTQAVGSPLAKMSNRTRGCPI